VFTFIHGADTIKIRVYFSFEVLAQTNHVEGIGISVEINDL